MELKNPVARQVQDGVEQPVLAEAAVNADGRDFYCYDCGEKLVLRRESKDGRRQHFAHGPQSVCGGYSETTQHNTAKHLLATQPECFRFWVRCRSCRGEIRTLARQYEAPTYAGRKTEVAFQNYRLDAAIFSEDGIIKAALEVFMTHRVDKEKAKALRQAFGNDFWEVHAKQVLRLLTHEGEERVRLECINKREDVCSKCVKRKREEEERREAERAAEMARMAMEKEEAEEAARQWELGRPAREKAEAERAERERKLKEEQAERAKAEQQRLNMEQKIQEEIRQQEELSRRLRYAPVQKPKLKPKPPPLHRHKIPTAATMCEVKKHKPAVWGCCMADAAETLCIPTQEYLPKHFSKAELDRLRRDLNYTGADCPSVEIAGPHAGTHCGLRLLTHLQILWRQQQQLQRQCRPRE